MAITIEEVQRTYAYNGVTLAVPDTSLTPEAVRDLYTAVYPELTTAEIDLGPVENGKQVVTFRRVAGSKG